MSTPEVDMLDANSLAAKRSSDASARPRPRVALIGAGGLGGPLAYALAAARCRLTVYDHDAVELSNLQRQIQFTTADVGRPKATAMAEELARRGHSPQDVRAVARRFTWDTADELIDRPPDVIVDGTDDFATKFAVNDWAVSRGIPFVIAGVIRYTGQVFAGVPGAGTGCYRCLFESPPDPDDPDASATSCAQAGVLGAAVAVIAGLAARAVLALIGGGLPRGALWVVDDVRAPRLRAIRFAPRPDCPAEISANHLPKE